MPRTQDFQPDRFDDLLAWLDRDRESASAIYLDVRDSLFRIFVWNQCADPEGMTDEVIDRVTRQVLDLRDKFEGNPKLFFYGVANNLIREYRKKLKYSVPLDAIDMASHSSRDAEDDTAEMREDCLMMCLAKLSQDKRDLLLSYYSRDKQAKITHRAELARQQGISIEALRVRMLRLRGKLEECIEICLEQKKTRI
jgi:RNA polymerase sigma factor (sigma-70 family)